VNRREFCLSLVALPGVVSSAGAIAFKETLARATVAKPDCSGRIHFVLYDPLEHPFYWWPRTLLRYPVEFDQPVDLRRMALTRVDTGERIPIQFSEVVRDRAGARSATLNFFSDLPSGARREFVLSTTNSMAADQPLVREHKEGRTIILDSGVMSVRIPSSQKIQDDAPGPIIQVSRGGLWFGSSTLRFADDRVTRITARRLAEGPLFIAYELSYETKGGARYVARIQCDGGIEFIRFQEDMEGLRPGMRGTIISTWYGLGVTHRQAPNHPFPLSDQVRSYDDYPWERIDAPWTFEPRVLPDGRLPFALGVYERAPGNFRTGTFANFWNQHSGDALGIFIDKVDAWQDHQYAYEVGSPTLQVRYHYQDGKLLWKWPLARGRRSTCIAFYDHAKDQLAMRQLERCFQTVQQDGFSYGVPLTFTSHTLFLQNRYGSLDLNRVKDWVLEYPDGARRPAAIFSNGVSPDPAELERRVMTSPFVCTLPVSGTRQMAGHGPIPGRNIVNFSPVPSRQMGAWIEGFNRCSASMTERQRRRLTALFLFMAHVHAGDEFMPVVTMLSGHPNFLADVKAVPAAMSFLFPEHPQATTWADMWEKCVELNTRYNTRPRVKNWDAWGGRWTENLGTYVWAFLRPSLRTEFLLRQYDGHERFISPQLAEMANWLVHALSAPFNGESEEGFKNLKKVDQGREWGVVAPGKGPMPVHPPQGAHSEQRFPPRSLWYLGTCLRRYAPLAAEYAMWPSRPTDPDAEDLPDRGESRDVMYQSPDNRGTNPRLCSRKFTGYGIVMRAAVDSPDELSIHLQQIDEGSNYRWGRAGEGGCGILYFYAGGKSYSYTGPEDVGDRDDQDTDFCTTFGVYKNGKFHSIGMNVLSRPFYDLITGQYAELVPREGPAAYAAPEYVSRSVLLAGHEYFVLHDRVSNQALIHRLTWFVRKGDELPTIKLLLGAFGSRETQRTELSTASAIGMWFDGLGDSLAVVSHRKDINAEGAPFGCRVSLPGIQDLVFRNPEPVHFVEGNLLFDGTAGLIRTTKNKIEFSLFHGTLIGVPGLTFTTEDTDLGIGGSIVEGRAPSGEFFAPKASSARITAPFLSEKTIFYIDGAAANGRREPGALLLDLTQGRHHWELTDALPVPIAPRIVRTENFASVARIIIEPVAGATQYRLELSKDGGSTWAALGAQGAAELEVSGLEDQEKVHVRVVALNSMHASAPGAEYPLYVTNRPPPPPDGLRVELSNGAASVSWGQILGASEYRLYARVKMKDEFHLLYRGTNRSFLDKRDGIIACNSVPGQSTGATDQAIVDYYVTALNGNGESVRSRIANTDPAAWRNWDPMPGERFRRVTSYEIGSPLSTNEWPRYYPD
jgi:hypothetical protein